MIYLRKPVYDLDSNSALANAAIESYRYAIECEAQYRAPASEQQSKAHQKSLMEILTLLGPNPSPDDFGKNRSLLRAEVRNYNQQVHKHFAELKENLLRLQESVSDLLGSSGQQMETQEHRLGTEIHRLEGVLKVDDLTETRRELSSAIGSLEQAAQDMKMENRAIVAQYRAEIRALQSWTEETVSGAKLDAATGFLNRAEFERQMGIRLITGKAFSVVYVYLENAKTLIRQKGRVGEEAVVAAAKRVSSVVVPARSGRWSDDEFLLLCDCFEEASAASHKLVARLMGEYTCRESPTKLVSLFLKIRTGVVQCSEAQDIGTVLKKIEELVSAFAGG
jgi:GGDEF domain-containing protein